MAMLSKVNSITLIGNTMSLALRISGNKTEIRDQFTMTLDVDLKYRFSLNYFYFIILEFYFYNF